MTRFSQKSLCLAIAIVLITSMLTSVSSPVFAAASVQGSGTASDPYRLYTDADMRSIPQLGMDKHYKMMNDITLTSPWIPIGWGGYYEDFRGVFDGNGNVLNNLIINVTGYDIIFVGLFGSTNGATIKNLGIASGQINFNTPNHHAKGIGTFIGYASGDTTIVNCYSHVNINGPANGIGGIVGISYGALYIENSYNKGNLTESRGYTSIGGIVGEAFSSVRITDCYNTGNLSNIAGTIGGIAGYISSENAVIERSYNLGTLSRITSNVTSQTWIGGILGSWFGTIEISDCYNAGNITAHHVGGIITAGFSSITSSTATVTRSYSAGSLTGINFAGGISASSNQFTSSPAPIYHINNSASNNSMVSAPSVARIATTQNSAQNILSNNLALSTMQVRQNNSNISVASNLNGIHGQSTTRSALMDQATYEAMGWDFNDVWIMDHSVSDFPILRGRSVPADPEGIIERITITHANGETYEGVIDPVNHTITFNVPTAVRNIYTGIVEGQITALEPSASSLTFIYNGIHTGFGLPPYLDNIGVVTGQQVFLTDHPNAVTYDVIVRTPQPTGPNISYIEIGGIPGIIDTINRTITFLDVPQSAINTTRNTFDGVVTFTADWDALFFNWSGGQHGLYTQGGFVGVESGVSKVYLIDGDPNSGYTVYYELEPQPENKIIRLMVNAGGTLYDGIIDPHNSTITYSIPASVMAAGILVGNIEVLETDCGTALPLTLVNIYGSFSGFGQGVNTSFLDGSTVQTSNKSYTVVFELLA